MRPAPGRSWPMSLANPFLLWCKYCIMQCMIRGSPRHRTACCCGRQHPSRIRQGRPVSVAFPVVLHRPPGCLCGARVPARAPDGSMTGRCWGSRSRLDRQGTCLPVQLRQAPTSSCCRQLRRSARPPGDPSRPFSTRHVPKAPGPPMPTDTNTSHASRPAPNSPAGLSDGRQGPADPPRPSAEWLSVLAGLAALAIFVGLALSAAKAHSPASGPGHGPVLRPGHRQRR